MNQENKPITKGLRFQGYQLELLNHQVSILLCDSEGKRSAIYPVEAAPQLNLSTTELYRAAWLAGINDCRSGEVTASNIKEKLKSLEDRLSVTS